MKKILTISLVVALVAFAVYLIFFESGGVDFSRRRSVEPVKPSEIGTPSEDTVSLETREEIYRLSAKKQKSDIPKFKSHLSDSSPMVRLAAARAIYEISGAEELPELVKLFRDADKSVRAAVIQLVCQSRDLRLISHLAEVLKTDKDLSVRIVAVDALRKIQDESCVPILIESLKDSQLVVRSQAQSALKEITFQKFEFDERVLKDNPEQVHANWLNWLENEQVKKNFSLVGVKELETRGDATSVRILARIAHSENSGTESQTVKSTAVSSLCRMNSPEAASAFKEFLIGTDEHLCLGAINAIVANKKKGFLSDIQKLSSESKSEIIRTKSSWALTELSK